MTIQLENKTTDVPDQGAHQSYTNLQIFKPDLIIENALKITKDNKPISNLELAKLSGFNEKECEMLQMFWQPAFNNSWIYLNDEIIQTYLTNDVSKDYLQNFYKRILLKTYEEGIDYKEVSKDNELVKSHSSKMKNRKSHSSKMVDEKSYLPKMVGNRKKYYIVSGECYKCLLMNSKAKLGKDTRKYFIKVEQLAIRMKDYLNFVNMVAKDMEIKKIRDIHQSMLRRKKRTVYERGNVVYIVSNPANNSYYGCEYNKIGIASQRSDEGDSAFMQRLSTYNTGSPHNYNVEALFYIDKNEIIEQLILDKFNNHINPSNKEWIKDVPVEDIIKFIVKVCNLVGYEYKQYCNKDINEIKLLEDESNEEMEERLQMLENIKKMNYRDLEDVLRGYNLILKGNKEEKKQRLIEYLSIPKKKNEDKEQKQQKQEEQEEVYEEEEIGEVYVNINGRKNPDNFDKFMKDYCEYGKNFYAEKIDVTNAYRIWSDTNDKKVKNMFILYLKERFKTRKKIIGSFHREVYGGFRLKKMVYEASKSNEYYERFILSDNCGLGYRYRTSFQDFFHQYVIWMKKTNPNYSVKKPDKFKIKSALLKIFATGCVTISDGRKGQGLKGMYGIGLKVDNYGLKNYDDRRIPVSVCSSSNDKIIETFPSMSIACQKLGISMGSLSNNIKNKRVIEGKYYKRGK